MMPYVHTATRTILLLIQANNLCVALKEYAGSCGLDLHGPKIDYLPKQIYAELDSEIQKYIELQEGGEFND